MGRYVEGQDRTQSVLFPERLDDWIHEDSTVRVIDVFVDELDLTGRLAPDFKTIADFRRDNGEAIRKVCKEFVRLCRRMKLFTDGIVAIDGSKFKAVRRPQASEVMSPVRCATTAIRYFWRRRSERGRPTTNCEPRIRRGAAPSTALHRSP